MEMEKGRYAAALVAFVAVVGILLSWNPASQETVSDTAGRYGQKVVIYKSPYCGCCSSYIPYLEKEGFQVEIIDTEDLSSVKEKYQIPEEMGSCHSLILGEYFVEGHVPMEAIRKLLNEKPEIDGIALPGMPAGSPGMPGPKTEAFVIYALSDGTPSPFMTL
jgi:hypothetical protein